MSDSDKKLQSREERTHNVVPVSPHDLTSQAYQREPTRDKGPNLGCLVSIFAWVGLMIFIFFILELLVGSWQRIK